MAVITVEHGVGRGHIHLLWGEKRPAPWPDRGSHRVGDCTPGPPGRSQRYLVKWPRYGGEKAVFLPYWRPSSVFRAVWVPNIPSLKAGVRRGGLMGGPATP